MLILHIYIDVCFNEMQYTTRPNITEIRLFKLHHKLISSFAIEWLRINFRNIQPHKLGIRRSKIQVDSKWK